MQQHGDVTGRPAVRWAYVVALAAIIFVSRIPQLTSPHRLLDGDECILGLMAKHVADGVAFPIFFYGQNYGLAAIEAPASALSFALFGIGSVQLKLAILALWTVGAAAFFFAGSSLVGTRWAFGLTLALVLSPAWAVASMKGWSGYVTSFAATGVLLAIVLRPGGRPRTGAWLLGGLLTGVVFLAQPLWLPGIVPIVIFLLVRQRRPRVAIVWIAGAALVIGAVRAMALRTSVEYWTPPPIGNPDAFGSIPDVLRQIHVALTGSYNLAVSIPPGRATAALSILWLVVLIVLIVIQIYRLGARRFLPWSHVLFLSVAATLTANWLLLAARDGRYLLPLMAPLVLWVGVEALEIVTRRPAAARPLAAAAALVFALGIASALEFRQFSFTGRTATGSMGEEKRLGTAIAHMRMRGAAHAVSLHPLLQWQVMFYSRETIVARWTYPVDRHPPYVDAVDRAVRDGAPVAIVGYAGASRGLETLVPHPRSIVSVDGVYVLYVGADRPLLERLGVRFRPQSR